MLPNLDLSNKIVPTSKDDFNTDLDTTPQCYLDPNLEPYDGLSSYPEPNPDNGRYRQCPTLPISPRTIRLLTSPIKLHRIKENIRDCTNLIEPYNEQMLEVSQTIPDMSEILKKFNIQPDKLTQVDLIDYERSMIDVVEASLSDTDASDEPTISQRIRTLVRHSRKGIRYSQR